MSCRPARVRSTEDCLILNVSVRAASLRVQPLSGSHSPPSPRMVGGPRPYGSATLGATPWPGSASTGSLPESPARTATGSPPRGYGSRSSTPNCTTDYSARCLPPTSPPHHPHYERHCTPSTFTSTKPSTALDSCRTQPKNSRQLSTI